MLSIFTYIFASFAAEITPNKVLCRDIAQKFKVFFVLQYIYLNMKCAVAWANLAQIKSCANILSSENGSLDHNFSFAPRATKVCVFWHVQDHVSQLLTIDIHISILYIFVHKSTVPWEATLFVKALKLQLRDCFFLQTFICVKKAFLIITSLKTTLASIWQAQKRERSSQ